LCHYRSLFARAKYVGISRFAATLVAPLVAPYVLVSDAPAASMLVVRAAHGVVAHKASRWKKGVKKGLNLMEMLQIISRMIVSAILVFACVAKLVNFRWFVRMIAGYKLWPAILNIPAAIVLTILELLTGSVLLLKGAAWSAWTALALFVLFGTVIAINLARRKFDAKCGCFGPAGGRISWRLLVRNISLAGMAWLSTGTATDTLMVLFWPFFVVLLGLTLSPVLLNLQPKSHLKEA
jgi:hypothetical protein